MDDKNKTLAQEKLTHGEEILGNLGFWPIVAGILALTASFLFKEKAQLLLSIVFALLALAKAADAARYIIYRKEIQKGVRCVSLCILWIGLAVCARKLLEVFAL